jgi:uncharacterized membrane protein
MKWFVKFDKFWLGFILAILVPVITLFITYHHTFGNQHVPEFFQFLRDRHIMSKLFSLCVLPNLALFFLYIWGNFLKGARGVLAATILVAVIIVFIQFVL